MTNNVSRRNNVSAKNSNSDSLKKILITIGIVMLLVLLGVGGYYLYKRMTYYKSSRETTKTFIPYIHDAKIGKTIQAGAMPPSAQGNEYNYNMWIYISDYDYRSSDDKCIIYRGTDPSTEILNNSEDLKSSGVKNNLVEIANPSVWLLKKVNTLRVRIGLDTRYQDPSCESFTDYEGFDPNPEFTLRENEQNLTNVLEDLPELYRIRNEYNELRRRDSDTSAHTRVVVNAGTCDIENIPLQRWLNLNISLHDNVIDIAIDGKLEKSCILAGAPIVTQDNNLFVCRDDGFNGYVANLNVSNKALPLNKVYSIYKKGPVLKKSLF